MAPDKKYEYERRLKLCGVYTRQDLKRAFKRAAKNCHPDIASFHGIPPELAEENMKRVNEAFSELDLLFSEYPYREAIDADYNPEGDQIQGGHFIFDDELFLGAQIEFGRYPIKRDHAFLPLVWYVIELDNEYATLITDECIDCRPFHSRRGDVTWARSDIRTWLNTVFFDRAFTNDEKETVVSTKVTNSTTNRYGVHGGPNTTDKVFLLSAEEAKRLFANWRDLATNVSDFAEERGSYHNDEGQGYWWLRSPGRVADAIAYVAPNGYIHDYDGRSAVANDYSVRPTIRIRLKKRSADQLERDTERARRKAAADKQRAQRTAEENREREAKAQAEQSRAAKNTAEEANARKAGFTPFESKPKPGQIVEFGTHTNGQPMKWRVLKNRGDAALVLSEELVSSRPFANTSDQLPWEKSLIRTWLNHDFFEEAFSPSERSAVIDSSIGQQDGRTFDRLFLLSIDEVKTYLPKEKDRIAYASESMVSKSELPPEPYAWWLRTPGSFGDSFVAIVDDTGRIVRLGVSCSDGGVAVRPAAWVRCP